MGPKTKILLELLVEIADTLRQKDSPHWEHWIRKDIELITLRDFYGVKHFLSGFGGAGSLNDLTFLDSNEQQLLSHAHTIALEIEREATDNN